jgi:NAD(P)-dependent dehydrogenase (short-subunit alcohol dehydrogenase family)
MQHSSGRPEVVVVTGASAGLGRAIVREFAQHGAQIGLVARGGAGMDGLQGAKRDVEALGGKAVIVPAEVASYDQLEAAAAKVEETFGPIDVWVNNAMITVLAEFKNLAPADFKRVTVVTYLGQVYGTMVALKRMLPRDRGHIVLVGSALAYRGIPLQAAYCGAKHGIQGMFDSLRCELLHDGSHVRVTLVQMPAMNTPQFAWCKTTLPQPAAAGPSHLPARGRRARRVLRRAHTPPRVARRPIHYHCGPGQQALARAWRLVSCEDRLHGPADAEADRRQPQG